LQTKPENLHELRSYGRKRGRTLSPRQRGLFEDLLPQVCVDLASPAPTPLTQLFETPTTRTWLEIGFGGGEHLIHHAERNPGIGMIGAEPFEDGVVKALDAIHTRALANVRVHADDARPLLRWLPAASIDRAFILFPDPWPKKKHVKRRLVSAQTLTLLASAVKPGAELRVATDIGDYARTVLLAIRQQGAFEWPVASPEDWRQPWPDWPGTRYEAKAMRERRRCHYFTFLRRPAL
jgi:tRNA (guanine-N7-)-methyltransferase